MAYPTYTTPRSIPGAATPAYLTAALASGYVTSQTLTVNSTAGWYEVTSSGTLSSNPLGTSGIFTLVVDYGSATEEKILCSGVVAIGSNVAISVWSDSTYNGRGWDGTPISAHVSGTLTNYNVFPVRTAVDDLQFNTGTANSLQIGSTASGDLTGTYPAPTLAAVGISGTYGSVNTVPVFTTDTKGRVTTVTATGIQIPESQVTNLTVDLASKLPYSGGTISGNLTVTGAFIAPNVVQAFQFGVR